MRYYPQPGPSGWAVLAFIVLCLVLAVGWAELIHGDWRCAFAQCRIETR